MNKRLLAVGIAALVVGLGAVVALGAESEELVSLDKVPAKVRATIEKHAKGGTINEIEVATEKGKKIYEVELKKSGKTIDFRVSAEGKFLGLEADEDQKKSEAADKKHEAKKGQKERTRPRREAKEDKDEDDEEAKEDEDSEEEGEAKEDKDDEDEDEGKEDEDEDQRGAKGKTSGFATKFRVNKANLVSTGKNPYFILEPGYCLELKGGKATLTITVLDDTKLVDGVETRVVEEREESNGQLTEVSRNYFAIDKTTKSVYYFGEDVDIYQGGKVVRHEGEWLSGAGGATFGLIMPGSPKVGQKFYQEHAPGKAMDRCEVVSVNEGFTTPAGTFKNCLRARESSALEKGTEDKIYAPGVGLLKDEDLLLVKSGKKAAK